MPIMSRRHEPLAASTTWPPSSADGFQQGDPVAAQGGDACRFHAGRPAADHGDMEAGLRAGLDGVAQFGLAPGRRVVGAERERRPVNRLSMQ